MALWLEEKDDDFSFLTHTNYDLGPINTSSKKHKRPSLQRITADSSSNSALDDLSSIQLPASDVSASTFASSIHQMSTRFAQQAGSMKKRLPPNALPSLNEKEMEIKKEAEVFSDESSDQSSFIHLPDNDQADDDDDEDDLLNLHLAK